MNISFYLHSPIKKDGRAEFVGRLEWAGAYCFTCDISLVTGNKGGIDVADPKRRNSSWYDTYACPQCRRGLNGQPGVHQLEPTAEEALDQEKNPWPVRFATAFRYALPIKIVKNLQKDTALISHSGEVMTAEVFRKKFLNKVTFHFSPPKK
ncbi:MAG: hypothetical protein Q8L24_00990 [bacterium]|nr:hypothetical protein [bacterium]